MIKEGQMTALTISTAAQKAGVGVETIRFYERKGLIDQPLKPVGGGYRSYSSDIIKRIQFVRQAQELGFSLKEIDLLLGLRADPDTNCQTVQLQAQEKLVEVETKIDRLQSIGAALRQVIAACPSQGGLESCSIIAAMENPSNPKSNKA
jgi:MerR family transcriptional regulator, copper efflux regulator